MSIIQSFVLEPRYWNPSPMFSENVDHSKVPARKDFGEISLKQLMLLLRLM